MQEEALRRLVEDIQRQKTEKQTLELKTANGGFPNKIYDTLSSFSNQDEGGIIVFGISEKDDYKVVGVYNASDVQKKVMEWCEQMCPIVRAVLTVCEIDGKMVVSAEIPGVEITQRPVYYAGAGKVKGSFVRVTDGDKTMTPFEVYSYEAFRKRIQDDIRVVENAKLKFFNQERMDRYLKAVKRERDNLVKSVSDQDILELMGVTIDGKPTLAGLMTFSQYPQTYFPQLCITAVVVPGTEIGVVGKDGERFIDNKRITGAIPDMLEEAMEFVRKNSRTKTIIGEDGQRRDRTEYPMKAVREAILNALVHRDYSIYTESIPVTIEMFRDRMEIKNGGGLFGGVSIENLGHIRTETRNVVLVNILELLNITENRYSGIPTMKMECREYGLPEPEFKVVRGEFVVIFRNNIYDPFEEIDKKDMKKALLQFCRVPRSRQEITEFTGKSRYYTMSAILQPLIDNGEILQTIPDKPRSPKQLYVTAVQG